MNIVGDKEKLKGMKRIEKALTQNDFLTGGLVNPDRKNAFERMMRGTNDMMNTADIEFTDTLSVKWDKQYLGRRVLEVGTEATTFTAYNEPDFGQGTTTLQKLSGGYEISYEALLQNIEKKDYQANLTRDFMEKAATDISDLAVNGDTASSTPFYAKIDGFYKLSDAGYIMDQKGNTINRNMFHAGFRALPKEVRRKKSQLRWYMNTLLETDWREQYGNRATVGGDASTRGVTISPDGIPFSTCDEIGDDISVGYTSATYGEQIGTVYDTFVLTSGVNDAITVDITIDGAASGDTALLAGTGVFTAPALAAALNAKCVLAGVAEVFSARDGKLVIRSTKTGSTQAVKVTAVAASMYTAVGFTAQTDTGTDASAAGTIDRGTYAWLTLPKNFKVYMKEDFRTYVKYVQEDDIYRFNTHFFMNVRLVDPTAIVRADNIRLLDYA